MRNELARATRFAWDLATPVQDYCITEYDLYRDFKKDTGTRKTNSIVKFSIVPSRAE